MAEEIVTLAAIAGRLGRDRSNARKLCNRFMPQLGLQWRRIRSTESRGQASIALLAEEADALLLEIGRAGFVAGSGALGAVTAGDRLGRFYLIQLVPDLAPQRVKLGYADHLDARVSQHRTAAPTATVIKSWPCRATWELACIASATREGSAFVSTEVFDCADLASLERRIDAFFEIMPKL